MCTPTKLLGCSNEMQTVKGMVQKAARLLSNTNSRHPRPILLRGESGTGKEVVAKQIHHLFGADQPFLPINCGAISPGLLESELFGHARGSFTGAYREKIGLLEAAGSGIAFLDEIGDLPLSLQVKLLRALQEQKILPIGRNAEREIKCRFIFATNVDLEKAITEGRFREDLYYRINVFDIHLPSLRQRPGDIPELVQDYLQDYTPADGEVISTHAIEALKMFDWPGNIRQLQNVLERAMAMAEGTMIQVRHLPADLRVPWEYRPAVSTDGVDITMAGVEKRHILDVLQACNGNLTKTATLLEISRQTLRCKLRQWKAQERATAVA